MFGLPKSKPETPDTPVRLLVSRVGHITVGETEFGESIPKVFSQQENDVVFVGKHEAVRMQAAGQCELVSADAAELFKAGLIGYSKANRRWEPTPSGVVAMTSTKGDSRVKAKMEACFA